MDHKLSISKDNGHYTAYCSCGEILGRTDVLLDVREMYENHKKEAKK